MKGGSMKRWTNKPQYLYYSIGVVLAILVGIQVYWIVNSIKLQKTAVERTLKEDMDKVAAKVEEDAYCFSFYSKAFIKQGEGIYIVRQKQKKGKFVSPADGGYLDTLDLFNIFYMGKDTVFDKERSLWFESLPATLDVSLKFSFIGQNPGIKRKDTSSYIIDNLNSRNFKDVLANKFKIDEAINIGLLDSLIKQSLKKNKLDTAYEAGIRKEGSKNFEYLKPGSIPVHLANSSIKTSFLSNRFNKPYELLLYVPDSFNSAIRSLFVMMVSSFIIMLILIGTFAYFVKTLMRQRKLSEMKNTFINNITHEFRTPITNINLAVENWRDMPDKGPFYLNIIDDENRHMERNVEQILQLATIEHSNGYGHAQVNVNMHELVKETVKAFEIQLERVEGKIEYHLNAETPWIKGDQNQLKNLLFNLVDNAIKYRDKHLKIVISTYETVSQFVIQIEDNGIGMSAETQKLIFNRFYRGYTGDKHDVKGFGLGLSYVKHIVETHGGEIYVKSRPGKGAKFTMYFPKNL